MTSSDLRERRPRTDRRHPSPTGRRRAGCLRPPDRRSVRCRARRPSRRPTARSRPRRSFRPAGPSGHWDPVPGRSTLRPPLRPTRLTRVRREGSSLARAAAKVSRARQPSAVLVGERLQRGRLERRSARPRLRRERWSSHRWRGCGTSARHARRTKTSQRAGPQKRGARGASLRAARCGSVRQSFDLRAPERRGIPTQVFARRALRVVVRAAPLEGDDP